MTAASAVVAEAAKQIQAAASNGQGSRRKLLEASTLEFDTTPMVAAAATEAQVTLPAALATTLAATTAAAAQFASNETEAIDYRDATSALASLAKVAA